MGGMDYGAFSLPFQALDKVNGTHLLSLSSGAVATVFFVLFIVWCIYSWILLYHWREYSPSKLEVVKMAVIYFTGSGIIVVLAALAFSVYSLSSVL